MARLKDKEKAINLRLKGYSYGQIKQKLKVSKSTLSAWLKDYPLTSKRINELKCDEKRIEKYRETCQKRREKILNGVYKEEKRKIFPLLKRDLFIAGLFLYWGEGGKTQKTELILSNTNPVILKFFIHWADKICGVDRDKLKIKLHLYKDMNIEKEINFWSKTLNIKESLFSKPYIKDSTKSSLTYKTGFAHGTCNVRISNAILCRRVLMGLKAIENYFRGK